MSSIIGKCNRAYKTSRVPHIDSIPLNWSESKIKHVASVNPSLNAIIDDDKPVGYVPMECVKNGYMEPYTALKSELSTGLTVFQNGDIVLAKVTPCFENGNIAIAFNLKQNVGFGSSELFVFRAHGISTKYLFYFLQTSGFMADGVESMTGAAGLKRVSPTLVKNYVLPVPPMDEQEAIVSYIEAHVRNVNEAISRSKAIIEKLIEYRKSVIKQAVTKGISHSVSFVDSGSEWIGQIPSHWKNPRLKFHCIIRNGSDPQTSNGNIPVFGSGEDIVKYCEEFKEGPVILLGRKGTLDKPKFVEGKFWNVDTAMDAYPAKDIIPKYLFYVACCFDIPRYATCTAKPSMTQTDYYNMIIPYPPLDEQTSIASFIDAKCEQIDEAISQQKNIIEKLEEYKKSLIYNAVTGKIDCRKET